MLLMVEMNSWFFVFNWCLIVSDFPNDCVPAWITSDAEGPQVAGFVEEYAGLTFATVRGAG